MIERDGVKFQTEGFGMTRLEGETYTVTDGDKRITAYTKRGMSKQEVLEIAEETFGGGLTVK